MPYLPNSRRIVKTQEKMSEMEQPAKARLGSTSGTPTGAMCGCGTQLDSMHPK